MEGWIVIPNWDKFQAYRDRNPPWIKLWTELNSRDDWIALSCGARGLLVTCWLEYARSRGRARTEHIRSLCGAGTRASQFDPLIDAGFLQVVANKPKPLSRSGAQPEKSKSKKELDASPERPRAAKTETRIPYSAVPGVNGPASDTEAYVRGLVANGVITEAFELNDFELDDHVRDELQARLH